MGESASNVFNGGYLRWLYLTSGFRPNLLRFVYTFTRNRVVNKTVSQHS
jgi:hypothetical protein